MTTPRVIRVFLSSTFRDFGEERDLLVKKVFPELRRLCKARRVVLIDVDLRWGITVDEAQQGKVLPICLAEINRARPYFMGFIGERYGWIPAAKDYSHAVVEQEPWLNEHKGGKSVTELEILHGVLNNPDMAGKAFFYLRDSNYSQSKGLEFFSEGPTHTEKLEVLKDRIRQSGFPVVENYSSPTALADRVRTDLLRLIEQEYPAEDVPDANTLENMRHEAFSENRKRLFISRDWELAALDKAVNCMGESFKPVLITGEPCVGKSALIANWAQHRKRKNLNENILIHHVAASPDATVPLQMTHRFSRNFETVTGHAIEKPLVPNQQIYAFEAILNHLSMHAQSTGETWLLLIDGFDCFRNHRNIHWLPKKIPAGIKLVVTCKTGRTSELLSKRFTWTKLEINRLSSKQARHFIHEYLNLYRKKLPAPFVAHIIEHPHSGHPIWLITLLEELRIFGAHEALEGHINTLLSVPPTKSTSEPITVDDLFEHKITRVQKEVASSCLKSVLCAIWASYDGSLRDELLELDGVNSKNLAEIEIALDENLTEIDGKIQFHNTFVRKAVQDIFISTKELQTAAYMDTIKYSSSKPLSLEVAQALTHSFAKIGGNSALRAHLLRKDVFLLLCKSDKYQLIELWGSLGERCERAYENAYGLWSECNNYQISTLSEFLLLTGAFGDFTESLLNQLFQIRKKAPIDANIEILLSINNLLQLYKNRRNFWKNPRNAQSFTLKEKIALDKKIAQLYLASEPILTKLKWTKSNFSHFDLFSDLCKFHEVEGNFEQAKVLYLGALDSVVSNLDSDANIATKIRIGLATANMSQGKLDEAATMSLAILERIYTKKIKFIPEVDLVIDKLATLLKLKRNIAAVESLYKKVISVKQHILGVSHKSTLITLSNLAGLLESTGRGDEATPHRITIQRSMATAHKRSESGRGLGRHLSMTVIRCDSKGKSTYITDGVTGVLVGLGVSARNILLGLEATGNGSSPIHAILIQNEHRDAIFRPKHSAEFIAKARGKEPIFYMTHGTLNQLDKKTIPKRVKEIKHGIEFKVGSLTVDPFTVPYDTAEPVAFRVGAGNIWASVLTQLGRSTSIIAEKLAHSDIAVLEFNHDLKMLMSGEYSWALKQRIRSNHGHLSNRQAAKLLVHASNHRLTQVVLGNLSPENNSLSQALFVASSALDAQDLADKVNIIISSQGAPYASLIAPIAQDNNKVSLGNNPKIYEPRWNPSGSVIDTEESCYQRLIDQRQTLGNQAPKTLATADALATIYRHQRRYDEAEKLYLDVLEARLSIHTIDHPLVLLSIETVNTMARQNPTRAKSIYTRLLAIQSKYFGKEHPLTLSTVTKLSHVYTDKGQFKKAIAFALRVVNSNEKNHGSENFNTLSSIENLAKIYTKQCDYDAAEELYLRLIDAREREFGKEHKFTLNTVTKLSQFYTHKGQFKEAVGLAIKVVKLNEKAFGLDHSNTLDSIDFLAYIYEKQKDYKNAERLYRRLIDARKRDLGEGHLRTLVSINNLAWLLLDYTASIPDALFEELLGTFTDTKDWKHHWAALGLALCETKKCGDTTQANQVLTDLLDLLGEEHPRVIKAKDRIVHIKRG